MKRLLLAYCAGVVDSDGCLTIKRRRSKARSAEVYTYAATVFVGQVERPGVQLLQRLFGGAIRQLAPSCEGGKPIFRWEASHTRAFRVATALLPFLRIKRRQAEILLEFAGHMKRHAMRRHSFWYKTVSGEPCYSAAEAAAIKGVRPESVYQAVHNGSVPVVREGRRVMIPKRFWDACPLKRGQQPLPPEYIALREKLRAEIRNLNGPCRGFRVGAAKPGK